MPFLCLAIENSLTVKFTCGLFGKGDLKIDACELEDTRHATTLWLVAFNLQSLKHLSHLFIVLQELAKKHHSLLPVLNR